MGDAGSCVVYGDSADEGSVGHHVVGLVVVLKVHGGWQVFCDDSDGLKI